MPPKKLQVALITTILTAWTFQAGQAQEYAAAGGPARIPNTLQSVQAIPKRFPGSTLIPTRVRSPRRLPSGAVRNSDYRIGNTDGAPTAGQASGTPAPGIVVIRYPYLNAPLYASPRPDIPYQVGGTFITNQALFPHEMLYPHTYRALYPPYYYRARGIFMLTPWGIRSRERWTLEGTEVKVVYRSKFRFLSGFLPVVYR